MSEINLDYGTINATATVLNNAENNISPQIKTLYTQVQSLLDSGGGLYLQNTSPAISLQYDQFQSGALNCMSAITSFAGLFSGLVTAMTSFDQNTKTQIDTPSLSPTTAPS